MFTPRAESSGGNFATPGETPGSSGTSTAHFPWRSVLQPKHIWGGATVRQSCSERFLWKRRKKSRGVGGIIQYRLMDTCRQRAFPPFVHVVFDEAVRPAAALFLVAARPRNFCSACQLQHSSGLKIGNHNAVMWINQQIPEGVEQAVPVIVRDT